MLAYRLGNCILQVLGVLYSGQIFQFLGHAHGRTLFLQESMLHAPHHVFSSHALLFFDRVEVTVHEQWVQQLRQRWNSLARSLHERAAWNQLLSFRSHPHQRRT